MKKPYIIPVVPLYTKTNGMYVMDITEKPFPTEYTWIEKVSMSLPPGKIAGNHSHHHAEAFLTMTEGLEFYWQDEKKKIHTMHMFRRPYPFFLIVPSLVPHAVINRADHDGIMVKFANEPPGPMKRVKLIEQ